MSPLKRFERDSSPAREDAGDSTARTHRDVSLRIWITLMVVLVGLGGLYAFQFRNSREAYLTTRYLRSLALTARDVEERILHFRHILHGSQSAELIRHRIRRIERRQDRLRARLADEPKPPGVQWASLSTPPITRRATSRNAELARQLEALKLQKRALGERLESPDPPPRERFRWVQALARMEVSYPKHGTELMEDCPRRSKRRPLFVRLDRERNEPELVIDYPGCWNGRDIEDVLAPTIPIRARLPLGDLIEASRSPDVFESLLLVDGAGDVVYASDQTHLRFGDVQALAISTRDVDSAEAPAAGEPPLWSQSHVRTTSLAGRSYRLFSHPLTVGAERWALVGIADESGFGASLFSFPLNWVAVLLLALTLAVLAWPYLKLHYLRPMERVRAGDYLYLGMSALLGTALLTLALLDTVTHTGLRSQLDDIGSRIAEHMARDFRAELARAQTTLVDHTSDCFPDCARTAGLDASTAGGIPDLEIVFWLDRGAGPVGSAINHRSRGVGDLRVPDRTYFKRAAAGAVWTLLAEDPERARPATSAHRGCTAGRGIFVERIRVRSEGTKLTAIAMPVECPESRPPARVGVMLKRMESTFATVLPPSYAFAIVDGQGNVQYHTNDSLSLVERLFEEASTGRQLEAAVSARSNVTVNGSYHGIRHRFSVAPIRDTPWSIIVMRDTSLLSHANFQLVLSSALGIGIYALFYLLASLVIGRAVPGFRGAWFWPLPRPGAQYKGVPAALCLLVLFYALAVLGVRGWHLALLLLSVPPLTMSFLFLTLHRRVESDLRPWRVGWAVLGASLLASAVAISSVEEAWIAAAACLCLLGACAAMWNAYGLDRSRTPDLLLTISAQRRYAVVVFLTFVLLAILPATAIFRHGVRDRWFALTKLAQIELARSLEQRSNQVRQELRRVYSEVPEQEASIGGVDPQRPVGVYGSEDLIRWCAQISGRSSRLDCRKFVSFTKARPNTGATIAPAAEADLAGRWLSRLLPIFSSHAQALRQIEDDSDDESAKWEIVQLLAGPPDGTETPSAPGASRAPQDESVQLADILQHPREVLLLKYRRARQFEMISQIPFAVWPRDESGVASTVAAALAFLGFMLVIVYSVGRRLFGSEITLPRPFDEGALDECWTDQPRFVIRPSPRFRDGLYERLGRHGVVERAPQGDGPPTTFRAEMLRWAHEVVRRSRTSESRASRSLRTCWIDLRDVPPDRALRDVVRPSVADADIVVVDGAEGRLSDSSSTRELLVFLEELDRDQGKLIHILAAAEPRRWLARLGDDHGDPSLHVQEAPHAVHWEQFLGRFRIVRPGGAPDRDAWKDEPNPSLAVLARECAWTPELHEVEKKLASEKRFREPGRLTAEQVVELVREQAMPCFRRFWRFSTREEKLTLFQLADDAMVNPKNADVVSQLMQRGAIIRDPDFMIASRSLEQFIRRAEPAERFGQWEAQVSERSEWGLRRLPIGIVIALAAGSLLYSQADATQSTVMSFTALITGLPALIQLSSLLFLRGGRNLPVPLD